MGFKVFALLSLQIYKEEVKDLLVRDPNAGQNLPIREFIDGSIKIAGK